MPRAGGRHRQPGLGQDGDQRVLPQDRSICPPCSARSAAAPGGRATGRSRWARTRRAPASAASTTGCRPAVDVEGRRRRDSAGRHQLPASASRAQDCATSSAASAAGAAGQRVGLAPAPAPPDGRTPPRSRAAARSAASLMRRSSSDSSGQVKRAPFAMPWRSVSSGCARSFSTRGGRRLDHVAELGVVADLQARDAVLLRVIQLQRGDHPAAVVAQAAFGVQFRVEARRRCAPSSSRAGGGIGQSAAASSACRSGAGLQAVAQSRRSNPGSGPSSAIGGLARGAPARRARRRDRAGRPGPATAAPAPAPCPGAARRAARMRGGLVGVGEQPGPAILPRLRSPPDRSAGPTASPPAAARRRPWRCAARRPAAYAPRRHRAPG